MNLQEIEQQWEKDCKIDSTNLQNTTIENAEAHRKYSRYLNAAKIKLAKLEGEKNTLILLKRNYYLGELDYETLKQRQWKPRSGPTVLKTELPIFLQGDSDIIEINLKIAIVSQIVSFCESIIRAINNRQFMIKNIIEDRKFMNGGN